jgi:hypothetical protein
MDITCRIKQEIIPFILNEINKYRYGSNKNSHCHNFSKEIEEEIGKYIEEAFEAKPVFVATPPLNDEELIVKTPLVERKQENTITNI